MIEYKYRVIDDNNKVEERIFDKFEDAYNYAVSSGMLLPIVKEYMYKDGVEWDKYNDCAVDDDEDVAITIWSWDDTWDKETAINQVKGSHYLEDDIKEPVDEAAKPYSSKKITTGDPALNAAHFNGEAQGSDACCEDLYQRNHDFNKGGYDEFKGLEAELLSELNNGVEVVIYVGEGDDEMEAFMWENDSERFYCDDCFWEGGEIDTLALKDGKYVVTRYLDDEGDVHEDPWQEDEFNTWEELKEFLNQHYSYFVKNNIVTEALEDDMSDEDFVEAFGKALKEKHDKKICEDIEDIELDDEDDYYVDNRSNAEVAADSLYKLGWCIANIDDLDEQDAIMNAFDAIDQDDNILDVYDPELSLTRYFARLDKKGAPAKAYDKRYGIKHPNTYARAFGKTSDDVKVGGILQDIPGYEKDILLYIEDAISKEQAIQELKDSFTGEDPRGNRMSPLYDGRYDEEEKEMANIKLPEDYNVIKDDPFIGDLFEIDVENIDNDFDDFNDDEAYLARVNNFAASLKDLSQAELEDLYYNIYNFEDIAPADEAEQIIYDELVQLLGLVESLEDTVPEDLADNRQPEAVENNEMAEPVDYKAEVAKAKGLDESLSQEIASDMDYVCKYYNIPELRAYVDEWYQANYPDYILPEFAGHVMYSEQYWNEFENWLKAEKNIDLAAIRDSKKVEEGLTTAPAESDQELYGADNAVVDCKAYNVIAHSEDEKPLDCKMEKKPLEKPLTEDLDADLKAHNDYIEYLQKEIEDVKAKAEKEANEFIKKALNDRVAELEAALDNAIPEEVKNKAVEEPVEEIEQVEDVAMPDDKVEEQPEEEKEEIKEGYNKDEQARFFAAVKKLGINTQKDLIDFSKAHGNVKNQELLAELEKAAAELDKK